MTSKRLYLLLLSGIVLLLAVLVGGTYIINKQLQSQADTLVDKQQQLAVLRSQDAAVTKLKKDIARYRNLAKITQAIVPQDKNQAQTLGEINKLANESGVTVGSISFPSSTLGGTTGTTTSSKDALSQLQPVKNIPGVYSLQIIVQSPTNGGFVSYNHLVRFLQKLEHNRRTAQVTGITITPNPKNGSELTFSLTLQEYIKP